jgi:hypothetical protein
MLEPMEKKGCENLGRWNGIAAKEDTTLMRPAEDRRALIPLVTPLATGDRRRDVSFSSYLRPRMTVFWKGFYYSFDVLRCYIPIAYIGVQTVRPTSHSRPPSRPTPNSVTINSNITYATHPHSASCLLRRGCAYVSVVTSSSPSLLEAAMKKVDAEILRITTACPRRPKPSATRL